MNQLELFTTSHIRDGLTGVRVKLNRPIDREQPCHQNVCVIGLGKAMHAAALRCECCGVHRGWLSKAAVDWLRRVVNTFGIPDAPVLLQPQTELPSVKTALTEGRTRARREG